jgi:hypothetical protein
MRPEEIFSHHCHSDLHQTRGWPSKSKAARRPNYLDGPDSIQLDDDISEVRALLEEKSDLCIPTDLRDNISVAVSQVSPSTPTSTTTVEPLEPGIRPCVCRSRSPDFSPSKVQHSHRHTHIHYRSPGFRPIRASDSPMVAQKQHGRSKTCSPLRQTQFASRTAKRAYVRRRAASAGISALRMNRSTQVR